MESVTSNKKNIISNATLGINIYVNGIRKHIADSTYKLRISLTISGFSLQLRDPQQLILLIQMSYYKFVDSTNWSGFQKMVAISVKSPIFGAILSGRVFTVFV